MVKNKDRWSALSIKDRAALIDIYVKSGITDLGEIRKDYNSFATGGPIKTDEYGYPADITSAIVEADYPRENEVWKKADASNADMIQRLKQGSSRVTIPDWEDPRKVATHKMMSAGKYAVGNVQNINGQLFDFTDPKHGFEDPDRAAIDSAIERGDYIKFDTEGDAKYFAEHYKKHYNSFGDGGDTDDTKVQIPTTNIVTTDNYPEKLDEFNQYRQQAVTAFDSYDWDTYRKNLNKSDSLGREIAKYILNEHEKYVGSPLNKGNWAGTSEAKEPEDVSFLLRSNIREAGKDVTEWLKSYVNSEGFDRVRKNQESWWKKRHPYQKILFPILNIENSNDLNRYQQNINNHADKMLNYVLDGYPEMSFSRPYEGSTFTFKPRIEEDKEFPFDFAQMHEFDHLFNSAASSYSTINFEAMEQNTNTKKGHDSRPIEKHSDIIGLKYLLYKEGIYDARGGNDITPEQIGELRKKYPKLRPLIQMDDKKAAWMLNHVAQNTTNENRLDYVNPDNIAAFGGKLNLFGPGGPKDSKHVEDVVRTTRGSTGKIFTKDFPWVDVMGAKHLFDSWRVMHGDDKKVAPPDNNYTGTAMKGVGVQTDDGLGFASQQDLANILGYTPKDFVDTYVYGDTPFEELGVFKKESSPERHVVRSKVKKVEDSGRKLNTYQTQRDTLDTNTVAALDSLLNAGLVDLHSENTTHQKSPFNIGDSGIIYDGNNSTIATAYLPNGMPVSKAIDVFDTDPKEWNYKVGPLAKTGLSFIHDNTNPFLMTTPWYYPIKSTDFLSRLHYLFGIEADRNYNVLSNKGDKNGVIWDLHEALEWLESHTDLTEMPVKTKKD